MKRNLLMFLFVMFSIITIGQNKKNYHFLKVEFNDRSDLSKISRVISIDEQIIKGNTVYAYANNLELKRFSDMGYKFKIVEEPKVDAKSLTMATSVSQMANWDKYPTYEVYVEMMKKFATDYPAICKLDTIGFSIQNRAILALKISDNVNQEEEEAEFLYSGQMHGDEIVSYMLFLQLADYLLSNYETNTRVANMVDNLEIWINPASNPDGTYKGGNNSVAGSQRGNANNIDLNRNFPDPEDGQNPDGNEWQKENIAMMEFAAEHNFVMSANSHSGAVCINYPWDTWQKLHPDDAWMQLVSRVYADAAQEGANNNGYMTRFDNGITNGYAWYSVSGGRQDYFNYFLHCREVVLELSEVKKIAASQLPTHWNYNKEAMLGYLEECLYGVRGTVKNQDDEPISAKIVTVGHDADNSEVYTDADKGDYYRLIKAGTYNLEFSAYGYISKTIENVSVTDKQATSLNVVLERADVVNINGKVIDETTGNPVEGVKIKIIDTPLDIVSSNAQGNYTIENLMTNTYNVSIKKDGYKPSTQEITISSSALEHNFTIQPSNALSFEDGNIPSNFAQSGNGNWTVDVTNGYSSAKSLKSGNISNNQSSIITLTSNIASTGEISFARKVSSEIDYDKLIFYIDGTKKAEWSGTKDWEIFSYPVTAGEHTFKWEYKKDNASSNGSDCAWIDYIDIPAAPITTPVLSIEQQEISVQIDANSTTTGILSLKNIGQGILDYTVEVENTSENSWLTIAENNGNLTANQSKDITLSFNSNDLTGTVFTANIIVKYNENEQKTIPVTLNISSVATESFGNSIGTCSVYPNPFINKTFIHLNLIKQERVQIKIYSTGGKLIKTLFDEERKAGEYKIEWNASNLNGGFYIIKIKSGKDYLVRKVILRK